MSMVIEIDISGAEEKFRRLARAGHDIRPALKEFKPIFAAELKQHFAQRQAEAGGWPSWAASYVERGKNALKVNTGTFGRRFTKKGTKRTRRLTSMLGKMATAFSWKLEGTFLRVYSKIPWAGVHQRGGTAGHGARIPQREFLWMSEASQKTLGDLIKAFLIKTWEAL
jgi:phage gpG-like protein